MKRSRNYLFALAMISFFMFQGTMTVAGTASSTVITGDSYGIFCDLPGRATAWKIAAPNGLVLESESATISANESLPDGQYRYEIIGYLERDEIRTSRVKEHMNNGREAGDRATGVPVGVIESGHFRIAGGVVLTDDGTKE